jgi:hypothetical protein
VWRLWHCWWRCEFESNDSRYHKTYQYGAFGEAFIHAERHSGQPRCPNDASLRIQGCGGFGTVGGDANLSQMTVGTIRPINTVLLAKLLYMQSAILANPGAPTMPP